MENLNSTKIDYLKILRIIFQDRVFFIKFLAAVALGAIIFSLSLENIYKSESILLANDSSSGFEDNNNFLSLLSGDNESSAADVAMESLFSEDFFREKIFSDKLFLNELIGAKSFDEDNDLVIYKQSLFKVNDQSVMVPKKGYDFLKTTLIFEKIFDMEFDKRSGFYIISAEHTSPILAQRWLKRVLRDLDDYMKIKESKRSYKSVAKLEELLIKTSSVDVRRSISKLIERELKVLVLAEASDYYIFNVVQSPTLPLLKDRPSRAILCIFIFILGFIVSIFLVLYRSNQGKIKEKIDYITSA